MPRRRLVLGLVIAAFLLVGGRAISALYADYMWYRAMGAGALWTERAEDVILVYGLGIAVAIAVAFTNLSALGRSIGALTLPRRLANVEFGEAVPRKYLDRFALVLSVGIAGALIPALPQWDSLALARLGVSFRERDPYFQHDLSFYTTWLPLEKSIYSWVMLLLVTVSVLVVALYSLTPGLRWERQGLLMSARVRRHLSLLAALLLFLTMWSYRLTSYDLLIEGGADGTGFSSVDHQWLLPGLLLLSIGTAAAAMTVLLSGWTGQLRTSFIAVTAVIVLAVTVQEMVPLLVRRFSGPEELLTREAPYAATRAEFTRRAYEIPRITDTARRAPSAESRADSPVTLPGPAALTRDSLVYPGASGVVVVADPQLDVAGARVGSGLSRLGYAWAYQSADLLSDSVSRRARIVAERDVRRRLKALAPVFAQGSTIQPLFHADTLYWKVELYSASSNYPLSRRYVLAGERRSYFRHAATALINARTARVMIAADPGPDPIAQAWMTRFPNTADYRAPGIMRELTATPWQALGAAVPFAGNDSVFRAEVTRLYNRMRAALTAADITGFGIAYDSLGKLIGTPRK